MTTVNRIWSDEDMELIREVFRAKVIRLGQLVRDTGIVNGDKRLQRIRYEYDKYKEFYADFGGKDSIGYSTSLQINSIQQIIMVSHEREPESFVDRDIQNRIYRITKEGDIST